MCWVGNERTMIVHDEDCEYGQAVTFGRREYDELYHALSDGYHEASCCLTDRPMDIIKQSNKLIKSYRKKKALEGCCICSDTRYVELAHIIPAAAGGSVTVPLCPNHHKAYDEGLLRQDELLDFINEVDLIKGGYWAEQVKACHGAVRHLREGDL